MELREEEENMTYELGQDYSFALTCTCWIFPLWTSLSAWLRHGQSRQVGEELCSIASLYRNRALSSRRLPTSDRFLGTISQSLSKLLTALSLVSPLHKTGPR